MVHMTEGHYDTAVGDGRVLFKDGYLVTVPEGLDISESPGFKRELLHKPPRPKIVHPHVNDHWDVDRETSDAKWIRIRQHAISHTLVSGVRFPTFVQDRVLGLSERHQAITAAKRPGGSSAEANQEEKKDGKCGSHGSVSFCIMSRGRDPILERSDAHEQCVEQQSCQLTAPWTNEPGDAQAPTCAPFCLREARLRPAPWGLLLGK